MLILTKLKPINFLIEVKDELSKVVWPSRQETIKLTAMVIFVSVAVGLFVGGLDFLFTKIMAIIINQ
jgi:preprotein translocase subunit SecE